MSNYRFINSKLEEEVFNMAYKYYYTQNILRNISIYKDKIEVNANTN